MIDTSTPVCPTCGGDLCPTSHIDVDVEDSELTVHWTGACTYCGNQYNWKEMYLYRGHHSIAPEG